MPLVIALVPIEMFQSQAWHFMEATEAIASMPLDTALVPLEIFQFQAWHFLEATEAPAKHIYLPSKQASIPFISKKCLDSN